MIFRLFWEVHGSSPWFQLDGLKEGWHPRMLSGIVGKMCWNPMGDLRSFGRTWGALGGKRHTPGNVEMKLMWCFSNVNVPGKLKGRDIGSYIEYHRVRNVANLFISYTRSHPKRGTMLPGSLRINAIRQWNGTWKEWEGRHRRYFNCFQLSYPTKTKTMTRKIKADQKALRIFQSYMFTFHLLFPICWLWLWLWIPFRCSNRASRGLMVIVPGSCLGSSCKRRAKRLECRCHRQNGIRYQKSWQRCFSTVCLGT